MMRANEVKDRKKSSSFLKVLCIVMLGIAPAILGGPVVTILLVCIKSIKKTTNGAFSSTTGKGPQAFHEPGKGGMDRTLALLFQVNRWGGAKEDGWGTLKSPKYHIWYIKTSDLSINRVRKYILTNLLCRLPIL